MSSNETTLKCKPKRYLWIDNLKMFACLLVVIGHLYMSMMAGGWISENNILYCWPIQTVYTFHVPLFFVCSGFLYQATAPNEWNVKKHIGNIKKKALALGVPYVTFSTITLLLKNVFATDAMEKNGIAEKYRASSYKSLKGKISLLSEILDNAYGKSYCQISSPTLIGNTVDLGISDANKGKSRAITHSFGIKLRALMLGEEAEITFCDAQGTKKKYKFTDEERLSFVLFGILYASRCNNFHGNVAARMNSINANRDTFRMYTDMFLTEYIILAIHMNSQGELSDMALNEVGKNVNLML